jgi:hypothetical protein
VGVGTVGVGVASCAAAVVAKTRTIAEIAATARARYNCSLIKLFNISEKPPYLVEIYALSIAEAAGRGNGGFTQLS